MTAMAFVQTRRDLRPIAYELLLHEPGSQSRVCSRLLIVDDRPTDEHPDPEQAKLMLGRNRNIVKLPKFRAGHINRSSLSSLNTAPESSNSTEQTSVFCPYFSHFRSSDFHAVFDV